MLFNNRNDNKAPIIVKAGEVGFSELYLQTLTALVWVAFGFAPTDNDNERVNTTRELMKKYYPYIPYSLNYGNRCKNVPLGIEEPLYIEPLAAKNGYYWLDVRHFQPGVTYRMNYHTVPGEESPVGTKLNPDTRDHDVSWPEWWD